MNVVFVVNAKIYTLFWFANSSASCNKKLIAVLYNWSFKFTNGNGNEDAKKSPVMLSYDGIPQQTSESQIVALLYLNSVVRWFDKKISLL